jgi:AraC-like DNA-binding protein/mannose-6-phosphate isomerase-like protein (cupin superfamily)
MYSICKCWIVPSKIEEIQQPAAAALMKAYFEKVPAGSSSFVVFERRDQTFPFDWHYHPEYELTLIMDSSGRRFVGDSSADYGPGDVVLLGPNVPHSWRSDSSMPGRTEHTAVVVQFRHEFLGAHFFDLEEMAPIARLLAASAPGLAFGHTAKGKEAAEALLRLVALPPARRVSLLLSILCDLAEASGAERLSAGNAIPMCRADDQERINILCRQLEFSFHQEINFKALAKLIHMDQASLCRFFKRATGRTLTEYITERRVAAAAQLLIETDLSLMQISYQVGFGNYSNFNRQFKRIRGLTPKFVRQQFQPEHSNSNLE